MHARVHAAQKQLQRHVPDEMAAAHRAVRLISPHVVRSTRNRDDAGRANEIVQRGVQTLQELQVLQPVLDGGAPQAGSAKEMRELQRRVRGMREGIEKEEEKLDRLLVRFNEVTVRFNEAVVRMAAVLRRQMRGGGEGEHA